MIRQLLPAQLNDLRIRVFSWRRRVSLAAVVWLGVLAAANSAPAQLLTAEMLIGDAVSEVGNRFPEVDEAIKRFLNRDVLGAREFLESARRKNATLPPTDVTMAKLYILSGDVAAGRASLEKAVMDNPDDPEAYVMLGEQAISPQQSRTIEAEALFDKALPLVEKFDSNAKRKRNFTIRTRTGRAAVYERRRQWDRAAADLQVLVEANPDDALARYRLGRALFMLDKARDGYNEFVKARELDKNLPHPYVAAASMYDLLGQRSEAQRAYERAVTEDANSAATLASYAQWLIKTGSIERAEEELAKARQADPESLDVLILSGVAAEMNKKAKPAEDYFMEALRISPSNAGVINQLALLLIEQPDDAKRRRALEFASINARIHENNAEANITHAWVSYQLGRTAEAEASLRKGLQLGNLNPDSSYLVAKMLVDQNRPDPAKQLLQGALEQEIQGIFVRRQEAQALLNSLR